VPNEPIPGVLVCHAFGGIGKLEEEKCRELAKVANILNIIFANISF